MPGRPDALAPSSNDPTDDRMASVPFSAALRPQARLPLTSKVSSQVVTSTGRPSEQVPLISASAASAPTRARAALVEPVGPPVNDPIVMNLRGWPGQVAATAVDGEAPPSSPPLALSSSLHEAASTTRSIAAQARIKRRCGCRVISVVPRSQLVAGSFADR